MDLRSSPLDNVIGTAWIAAPVRNASESFNCAEIISISYKVTRRVSVRRRGRSATNTTNWNCLRLPNPIRFRPFGFDRFCRVIAERCPSSWPRPRRRTAAVRIDR